MKHAEVINRSPRLDRKTLATFLAWTKRYMAGFTTRPKAAAPALSPDDWYRMNAAARAQSDFWVNLLMGRGPSR